MERAARSEPKRRGINLSISREKRSQARPAPDLNLTQPLSAAKSPKVTFGAANPQRSHSPGQLTFKIVPQRPKIIYEMKRSEWDILQESNRSKKQAVCQYRN